MNNRATSLLLLILVLLACYWLWKQPSTRVDADHFKASVEKAGDKMIEGMAKVSNKIEDSKIGERTENALDNAKEKIDDTGDKIRDKYEDAKARDRAEQ